MTRYALMNFEYVGDLGSANYDGECYVSVYRCSECGALVEWGYVDLHEGWHRDSS